MKLTDMIISAALKRGILYEARNVDTVFELPHPTNEDPNAKISILFKAEHMTLQIEKENKE